MVDCWLSDMTNPQKLSMTGGLTFNRRSSVGILQFILKQFENSMAYYYFYNPAINNYAGLDQLQSYYSSFGAICQNSSQPLANTYFGWKLPQSQMMTQNQTLSSLSPSFRAESIVNTQILVNGGLSKKRRAQKTLEKEIISAKKNSESNLINQFYSFFGSREKSERTVEKCCLLMGKTSEEAEKILPLFYTAIRYINAKRGRKYVNAAMLLKFFAPEQFGSYLSDFKDKIEECSFVNLAQLCEIFRRCTTYFLKNVSVSAILTSKRISIISKEEHLKKRRKITRTVLDN